MKDYIPPLLAIVIPTYKSTFLRETLESIANQTDKRFHLYIGDDCSPFDIKSIVKDYQNHLNITYKRFEKNLGSGDLVGQWERCIALTQKEPFIWLFSDDDIMEPRCVESFYKTYYNNPHEELFHFNINMIDSIEGGVVKPLPEFPKNLKAGKFLELKLRGQIVSFVVEFIFSRRLYEEVKGFQNFDLAWGSDFMTWLKMAASSKNGITTVQGERCNVNWRKSNENISPNKTKPILIRKLKALIANAAFIKEELCNQPIAYLPCKKSFRWIRFPLGEIFRNRAQLSKQEIRQLYYLYSKEVGYSARTLCIYLITCLLK